MNLRILQPGVFASVQDLGRSGATCMGVPRGGAIDATSLRVGNRLVGNPDDAAALEMTLTGSAVRLEASAAGADERVWLSLAGARVDATILSSDGSRREMELSRATQVRAGETLLCGAMREGVRAYLCVRGGIDVPRCLGSRSTLTRAGIGGHEGRSLRAGDLLRIEPVVRRCGTDRAWADIEQAVGGDVRERLRFLGWGTPAPEARTTTTIWVTCGPHADSFVRSPGALLDHTVFTVSPASDRMGLRLAGAVLPAPTLGLGGRLASEPMPPGAIQVPPDGRPIVLMCDGPTTGGYPVLASVARVHMGVLGQLAPGAKVRFVCVDETRARAELRRLEAGLARALPEIRGVLLNADVGEVASVAGMAKDIALMEHLDLINIACGGHAGDDHTMRRLVREAKRRGVLITAHPSYPDRAGFGRARMDISASALRASVGHQVAALLRIAAEEGAMVRGVKPHGALYHDCANEATARAVASGVVDASGAASGLGGESIVMIGACGSSALRHWRSAGLFVLEEGFADRTYQRDGTLRPRGESGSVLDDPTLASAQARALVERRGLAMGLQPGLVLAADTICVHGDTLNAVEIARVVRKDVLRKASNTS